MPKLTIDGREIEVAQGATVLDAARELGIEIPALCYLEGTEPSTSCLCCVVQVGESDRMVPSCATLAADGLDVRSETPKVHAARRTALELLLSDHLGDCEAPCERICPLEVDIPLMTRLVRTEDLEQAIVELRRTSPMPGVMGHICPANCENGCRRGLGDESVSIRNIEKYVSDIDRARETPHVPPRVAVVGAGPTGLSAAYFLAVGGHAVTVLEREADMGGSLRTDFGEEQLPRAVLDGEIAVVAALGVELRRQAAISGEAALAALRDDFDAVLISAGSQGDEGGNPWGLAQSKDGVRIDAATFQTEVAGVFAAGDVVKSLRRPVRSLAAGKAVASCLGQYLAGEEIVGPDRMFCSRIGRMDSAEIDTFLELVSSAPRLGPPTGTQEKFSFEVAASESERCLRCDCRCASGCKLRIWSSRYGADANRYKGERRVFEQKTDHPYVIFESGKCILCGSCVRVASEEKDALGLTFVGRGFNVKIGVPFDETMSAALEETARRAVECCPTGALSSRDAECSRGSCSCD